jgi:predicted ferric reductase
MANLLIFIKKSWRGLIFVLISVIINMTLWLASTPLVPQPFESLLAQALGGLILTFFFLVFLLSLRLRILINWFGGLDRMYFYHRWLAILPLFLISIHEELSEAIIEIFNITSPILGEANEAGETAQTLFIALIVIALLSKFIKYEHWRFIHRLMIIPFIYGLYHAFYSATFDLFDGSPLSIWMLVVAIGGMFSSFYMVFTYQWIAFLRKGKVTNITYPNASTIEIELTLKHRYRFTPGQFAFIKVFQRGIEDEPHPFSLSGQSGKKIYFTIKVLGDFTKSLKASLKLGTTIAITGAYGSLTMTKGGAKQLWIAGGIGITPFLSALRSGARLTQTIDFVYTYRNEQEAIHLDFLKQINQHFPTVTIHFHHSKEKGRLAYHHLPIKKNQEVYLCGPRPMVNQLVKAIRSHHPNMPIDYEAFAFMGTLVEDVLAFILSSLRALISLIIPKKVKQ